MTSTPSNSLQVPQEVPLNEVTRRKEKPIKRTFPHDRLPTMPLIFVTGVSEAQHASSLIANYRDHVSNNEFSWKRRECKRAYFKIRPIQDRWKSCRMHRLYNRKKKRNSIFISWTWRWKKIVGFGGNSNVSCYKSSGPNQIIPRIGHPICIWNRSFCAPRRRHH